jgi:hypothetical protein
MLFIRMLTYLEAKLLLLTMFYNSTFLLIKILMVFLYTYIISYGIIVATTILSESLLLSK